MDADARPLPSDDTTPPVTKMNFVCFTVDLPGAVMVVSPIRVVQGPRPSQKDPPGGWSC
jgi:hypothetical protein